MQVLTVVLMVTNNLLSYCRMIVNVSSISLSASRRSRRNAITDFGLPNRTSAWSIEWEPVRRSAFQSSGFHL